MYKKANEDFIQSTSDYESLEVNFQYGNNEGSFVSFDEYVKDNLIAI